MHIRWKTVSPSSWVQHFREGLVLIYTQWLTCDLAGDRQTLLWSCICRNCYDIIHIWSQAWDGGLSRRCRQSQFFCWFLCRNTQSQKEAIRKLLHYLISPRVKTRLQTNLILPVNLEHQCKQRFSQLNENFMYSQTKQIILTLKYI